MFPWIDNWTPLDSSRSCIKGIRGDISHSSKDVKFNTSGLSGNSILLALEQLGNLPFFRFESQVIQIHSESLTLLKPVRQDLTTSCEHFTTEDLYHNWSTTSAYIFWAKCNVSVKQTDPGHCINIFCNLSLPNVTCDTFGRSWKSVSLTTATIWKLETVSSFSLELLSISLTCSGLPAFFLPSLVYKVCSIFAPFGQQVYTFFSNTRWFDFDFDGKYIVPRGRIDHFTAVCSVTWPLNGSEAGGDLVLIMTSLILLCKSSWSNAK